MITPKQKDEVVERIFKKMKLNSKDNFGEVNEIDKRVLYELQYKGLITNLTFGSSYTLFIYNFHLEEFSERGGYQGEAEEEIKYAEREKKEDDARELELISKRREVKAFYPLLGLTIITGFAGIGSFYNSWVTEKENKKLTDSIEARIKLLERSISISPQTKRDDSMHNATKLVRDSVGK